ncbi:hypothetical protein AK88_05305 [Plasmodium fragile]|uniref:AP2/ERF domain-containing protein n=1 Tax=Plasmodium fragile TaxID=5857 RepID=A0A0D9QE34_PLAFR|nr:uncharacterized protein AK88_05305 [Plasmodium fragile]KJP85067.1 hypothetical protein AK88_05305 [Plasmodium fragile]
MSTPYNYGNVNVNVKCQVSIKHKKFMSTQNAEGNNMYNEHNVNNNYQHSGNKNVQMYSNISTMLRGGSVRNGPNGSNAANWFQCPSANHMDDTPREIYHNQVHNKVEANQNKRPYMHSQNRMIYGISEVNESEKGADFAKYGTYKDIYKNQVEHFTHCRKKNNVNLVNAATDNSHKNFTIHGASSCDMPTFMNNARGENDTGGFTQDNGHYHINENDGRSHLIFHDVKGYGNKEIHNNTFPQNCLLSTFQSAPNYPFTVPSNERNTTENGMYETGQMYFKEEKDNSDEFSSVCFGGNKSCSEISYGRNSTKQSNNCDDGTTTNNSYLADNTDYDAHHNSIQNVDLISCNSFSSVENDLCSELNLLNESSNSSSTKYGCNEMKDLLKRNIMYNNIMNNNIMNNNIINNNIINNNIINNIISNNIISNNIISNNFMENVSIINQCVSNESKGMLCGREEKKMEPIGIANNLGDHHMNANFQNINPTRLSDKGAGEFHARSIYGMANEKKDFAQMNSPPDSSKTWQPSERYELFHSYKVNPSKVMPLSDMNKYCSGRGNGSGGLPAAQASPVNNNSIKSPCCFIQFDNNYLDPNGQYEHRNTKSEAKTKVDPFLMTYSKVPTSGKAALLDQMEFEQANGNDNIRRDIHPHVQERPYVGTHNNVIKLEHEHVDRTQGKSYNQNISLKQPICNRDNSHSNISLPLANTYRLSQDCQRKQIPIPNMYDKQDSDILCSFIEHIPLNHVEKNGNENKSCHLGINSNSSIGIDQVRGDLPSQANNIHMVGACDVNKRMNLNFNLDGTFGEVHMNHGSVSGEEASRGNRQCGTATRIPQPSCESSQVSGGHVNTNQWNELLKMSTNYKMRGACKNSLPRRVQGGGQEKKCAIGEANSIKQRQAFKMTANPNYSSMGNFDGHPPKEELGTTNNHTEMCEQNGKGQGVTSHNENVAVDALYPNAQMHGSERDTRVIKSHPEMRNVELASANEISMGRSGDDVPGDTCVRINCKKSKTHEMCCSLHEAHGSHEMKNMCASLTSRGSYFPQQLHQAQLATELEKKQKKILDILFSSKGVPHFVSNKTSGTGRNVMKNELTQLSAVSQMKEIKKKKKNCTYPLGSIVLHEGHDSNKKKSGQKITIDNYSSGCEQKHHENFTLECEDLEEKKKFENCFLYVSRADGEKVSHGKRKVISSSSNSSSHPQEAQHQQLHPRHLHEGGPNGVSDECAYMNGTSSQVSAFSTIGTSEELPNDYGTVNGDSNPPTMHVTLQGWCDNKRNVIKDYQGYINCVATELLTSGGGPSDSGDILPYGNSNSISNCSGCVMNSSNTKEEKEMRTQNDVRAQCNLRCGCTENGRNVSNISTYTNNGVFNVGSLTHCESLINSRDGNTASEVSMLNAPNVPHECSNYMITNNCSVSTADGTNVVGCPSNASSIQGTSNGSNTVGDAMCNTVCGGGVRDNGPNSDNHNAVLHTNEGNLSAKLSSFLGGYGSSTPNCATSDRCASNTEDNSKGYTVNGVNGSGCVTTVRSARNVGNMSGVSNMNRVNGAGNTNSINSINSTNDFSHVNMVNTPCYTKRDPHKDNIQGCETQIKDFIPNSMPKNTTDGERMRSMNQSESAILINKEMGGTATPFVCPENTQRVTTFKMSNANIHSEGAKCTNGTVMSDFQDSDIKFKNDNPVNDNAVKLFNGQGKTNCKVNNADMNRLASSFINANVTSNNVNPFYGENKSTCEMGKGQMQYVAANNFSHAVNTCATNDGKTAGTGGSSKGNSTNRRTHRERRRAGNRRTTSRAATNNAASSTTAISASNVTSNTITPSNNSNGVQKKGKAEQHEREDEDELHEKLKHLPRITGVSYDKKQKLWVSHWRSNCKTIHKYFSVKRYGFHNARLLAIKCRKQNTKYICTDQVFGYKAGSQSGAQPEIQSKGRQSYGGENHSSGQVVQLTGILGDKKPSGKSHSIRKKPKGRGKHCEEVDFPRELPQNESAKLDSRLVGAQKGDPGHGSLGRANPIKVSQNVGHQSSPPLSGGQTQHLHSVEPLNRDYSPPEQSDRGVIYPQRVEEGSKDQQKILRANEFSAKCTLKGKANDAHMNSGKTTQQSKNNVMHTEQGKNEKVEESSGKRDYLINTQLYNKLMNNQLYNKLINNQLSNDRVKNNNFYCNLINSNFYIQVINKNLHARLERNQREVTKEDSNQFYYGQFKNGASAGTNSFSNSEHLAGPEPAQDQNAYNLLLRSTSGDAATSGGTHKTSPPFTKARTTYRGNIITPVEYANNGTIPYSKNEEPPIDAKLNGFPSGSPRLAATTPMVHNYANAKDGNNLLTYEGLQNGNGSSNTNCDKSCAGGQVKKDASYFKRSAQMTEHNCSRERASTFLSDKKFLSGGTTQLRTIISNNQGGPVDASSIVPNNHQLNDAMNAYINREGPMDGGGNNSRGGVDDGGVLVNRMATQGRHFIPANSGGSSSSSSNNGSNHSADQINRFRNDGRDTLQEQCSSISNDPMKETSQYGCSDNFGANNQYATQLYVDGKYHHRNGVDMKRAIMQEGYMLSDQVGHEIMSEGQSRVGEMDARLLSHGGNTLRDPNASYPVNQMDEEKNKLMISKITTKYILTDIKNKCLRNCSSNFLKHFPDIKNVINKHINKISEANSIHTIRPYIQLFSKLLEKRKLLHMLAPNAQELYIYSLQKLPL